MHFSQTLEAAAVPEWKSRYVNFKAGKKLIGKLEKQLNSCPTTQRDWELPPPAMDPPAESSQGSKDSLSDSPNNRTNSPPGATNQPRVDDRSPLLNDSPNARLYMTPGTVTTPQTPNPALHTSDNLNEAEDVRLRVRTQFFEWVSRQTVKASDFYSLLLDEAFAKMAVLERQFAHFDIHKEQHHAERARMNTPKVPHTVFTLIDMPSLPKALQDWITPNPTAEDRHQHQQQDGHGVDTVGTENGDPQSLSERSTEPLHTTSLGSDRLRFLLRRKERITRTTAHTFDFNTKDDHVGYYQAKSMLRSSVIGYFQFLLQLREFRQLNQTAVRKIIKKFDKQLHYHTLDKYLEETSETSIRSSEKLDGLITDVENLFSRQFTHGNRKVAVDLLRARFLQEEKPHNGDVVFTGFALGAALVLCILGLYTALHHQHVHSWETNFLLQVYAAFTIIGIMLVGFGVCLAVWAHYRINYPFVIDFDRTTMLDYRQYPLLPAIYVFGLGLFGWLSFNTTQSFHRYYPCVYLGIAGAVFFFPSRKYLQGKSRLWLIQSLWRLTFSGLYPVEFRDLMMGDLFCSLTYPLSTIEMFFCVYSTDHWWGGAGQIHAQRCKSNHSRALGFLNCLPGIWRFLQCWRRFGDTLDWFPHLLNAGKYSFNILYNMSLSLGRITPHSSGLKAMFIVFALINGLYSGTWDILMDFSLSPASKRPRAVLVYPVWTYWAVMVADFTMRQNWVLYVIFWGHKTNGTMASVVVALIEVTRRIIWLAFRVENEHAANISRCRAFKELSLPYDDIADEVETRDEEEAIAGTADPSNMARSRANSSYPGTGTSTQPSVYGTPGATPGATPYVAAMAIRGRRPDLGTRSAGHSAAQSPSQSFSLSPRIGLAHTNDFQRRRPKMHDEDEDDDEED